MLQLPAFSERDPNYPAVQQLFDEYFHDRKEVNIQVAADDDMFSYSVHYCGGRAIGAMAYFRAGLSIFDCVEDIAKWKFGKLENVGSFLDFASGHGRFTRVLAAVYPKTQIWAAEIIPDAVRFQKSVLGVNALQSTTAPEDFQPRRLFDFIYVGSLFTHLPDRTFSRWLKCLCDLLTPDGVLVFTTHGSDHLKSDVKMPANGIYYIPETEIPSLDTADYGATIVTPEYVRRSIQSVTGGEEHWYQHRGLGFSQDLWIVSRSPLPKTPFVYDQGPQGHVDHVHWTSPFDFNIQCWAACICGDHTISAIRVLLNGEECGTLQINYDRPDIGNHLKNQRKTWAGSRGSVRTDKAVQPWSDILSFIAVCSGGKQFSLRTGGACTYLQFAPDALPIGAEGSFTYASNTTRAKVHRALDYAIDGDLLSLCSRGLDFIRGR